MARLEGKVAFVTGAARGQGRSHTGRLAEEGADIVAVDIASQIDTVPYTMARPDDLALTVKEVEALDRRIVATEVDVRDYNGLKAALDDGVDQLGRLDIVSANAGIVGYAAAEELSEQAWRNMIDVNLTGAWHTVKAAIPHLRAGGGGSIVITSSDAGLEAAPNAAHYGASKHGVVGLMRALADELAPDMVRVNTVHPGSVNTDMVQNQAFYHFSCPTIRATSPARRSRPYCRRETRFLSPGSSRWTSPTPSCSSPPTRPATSRASPSPSTPASSSSDTPSNTRARSQSRFS
jgi:SDR family mycofactocin-dependent oxidoreductase